MRKQILLIVTLGLFLYLPSLFGQFVWDDEDFVYANKYVESCNFEKFFSTSVTAGRDKPSNYYRPVQSTVYCLVHSVFGFNPFWYHLTNIVFHVLAACLVLYFLYLLTNNPITSFLVSLVFLVHPVQTEAVSYVSGLSDPLAAVFVLLSLIFYLRKDRRSYYIYISIASFILAFLSKESGLVVLPIIFLYELIFQRGKISRDRLWLFALLVISGLYLLLRFTGLKFADMNLAWAGSLYGGSLFVRLATFCQNFFAYLGLLIFPKELFMERDSSISLVTSPISPWVGAFILFNIVVYFFRFRLSNTNRTRGVVMFFYSSFLVSLLPFTGIILINGIFYEHFLYFPMIFFWAFVFSMVIPDLIRDPKTRHLDSGSRAGMTALIAAIILLFFIVRNLARQYDWIDNVRFYQQTLSHAPKSIRVRNGLAMEYAGRGQLDNAIRQYNLSIALDAKVPNLYHNLANTYAAKGDIADAEKNYLLAISVDPDFSFSYYSLFNLYLQNNQKEKAREFLEERLIPRFSDPRLLEIEKQLRR